MVTDSSIRRRAASVKPQAIVAPSRLRAWFTPLVALLAFIYPRHEWTHYVNLNETTRIYLTRAIVDEHVLFIDNQIKLDGDTHDKSEFRGHFYCDKPVGLSLLAVPVYLILKAIAAMTGHAWTLGQLRYLFAIFCISIPSVLALKWLRGYWEELTGDGLLADFAVLAYALGTIAFTYSTQFMGHQIAAVLAVAHFAIARKLRSGDFEGSAARPPLAGWVLNRLRVGPASWFVIAGLIAGFGTITEYFTVFLHAVIFAGYATKIRTWRPWAMWLAAAALGVCPLFVYNAAAFGGPFTMAYAHEATQTFQTVHSTGLLGVTYPRADSLWGLLLSPAKGLFFLSPFLIFFIVGAIRWREAALRAEISIHLACTTIIIYLAASLVEWPAGITIGPRHMVSMLPFMMSLVVLAVARWRVLLPWFVALSVVGMIFVYMATLTHPAFEANLENPLRTQALFLLSRGLVSPNPATACGITGAWSLLPWLTIIIAALASLAIRAHRASRRIISPLPIAATVLAIGWCVAVLTYEPEQPALRTLFQGRVLWWTDQLRDSAAFHERAMDMLESMQTPQARQIAVEQAAPTLMAIYQELNDPIAAGRLAARVARMNSPRKM